MHGDDLVGDKVLAGAVCRDNGRDDVLGHVAIVGKKLLGIFVII